VSEGFDPYHRWLGIPPRDQPASHYRLLGLVPFEDDAEVIRDAAERQIAHVRRYASGKHSDLSQRILNELAAAKGCLLDPPKKELHDAQLRAEVAREAQPVPAPPPDKMSMPAPPSSSKPPAARTSYAGSSHGMLNSGDPALKALAEAARALPPSPAAGDMVKLGDLWRTAAAMEEPWRRLALQRALYCCETALPKLKGFPQTRVARIIVELKPAETTRRKP